MNEAVQEILDRYAADGSAVELATAFRDHRRWTGAEPRLLLAEAAASTTGQQFVGGIRPTVERFRETFIETDRIDSFETLSELDLENDALIETVGARRKRHVLLEAAQILTDRPEDDDLAALTGWACSADHYRYESDPIGSISGVGPSSFQYLRQLAGVETIRPDSTAVTLINAIADELESSPLDTSSRLRTIASGEWVAAVSSYTPLEIDRLAWWDVTDSERRATSMTIHGLSQD